MKKLTVRNILEDLGEEAKFEVITDEEGLNNEITEHDINRPGLALAGYFEHFGYKRIQLLGRGEISYLLHLSNWARKQILTKMFSYDICCFIIAWHQDVPEDFIEIAKEHKVPIIRTFLSTGKITTLLTLYLEEKLAEKEVLHAGLVDVGGVGVLILGEAGIGKSEATLELIKRGHRLVADDVVQVHKIGNKLIGSAPEITKYKMEIRGLGIVDIRLLFGMNAICEKIEIDIAADLQDFSKKPDNKERSQLISQLILEAEAYRVLEVVIPRIIIPMLPGRDIAVLIEVGAMNYRLKKMGYDSTKEFEKELLTILTERQRTKK